MWKNNKIVLVPVGVQFLCLLAMMLLPFGFDHPSALGLDFDHFVGLAFCYGAALIFGVIASILRRRRVWLVVQLLIAAIGAWIVFGPSLTASPLNRAPDAEGGVGSNPPGHPSD